MPPLNCSSDHDSSLALQAVVDSSLAGFWDWNIPAHSLFMSPRLKAILGFSDQDLENTPEALNQRILPEDLPLFQSSLDQHFKSRGAEPFRVSIRLQPQSRSSSTLWVCHSGAVIEWSPQGDPIRMVGTMLDISEDKENERLLAQKEQRLKAIYQACHAAIWDRDVTTGVVFWSDRFYQLVGYTRDELPPSTENFRKLIHPDDQDITIRNLRAHLEAKTPYIAKYRIRHKSGHYRWMESVGKAIHDSQGKMVRIIGSCMDIHEDHQRRVTLENSLFQLNETTRIAVCGGWEADLKTYKVAWSKIVKEIFEVDEDFEPDLQSAIDFFHPDSIPILKESLEACIEHQTPYDLVLKIITAKQIHKWVRARGQAIVDQDDNVIKLRGILQDITQTHEQKVQLESTLALTAQQNKYLLEFAYIVSHHLRSHTGNLTTLSQLLDEEENPEERLQIQGMLKETSNILHHTIEDLTHIIKIQTDSNRTKSLCLLIHTLNKTTALFLKTIQKENIQITHNFKTSDHLFFDQEYLDFAFRNLIENAIRYRHPDRQLKIIISFSTDKNNAFLQFQDNGLGIDLDRHQNKIFNLYHTFHGNADATGVGLYLVRSQLEAFGASINVLSTPQIGSVFTIKFPLA